MIDETVLKVMAECNNYFARVVERVRGCKAMGAAVTCESGFKGRYSPGDLLRIHGAFCGDYGAFDGGECYEVVEYDGETLFLDHELHTKAPWLLVVYCEPTADFLALCYDIAAYKAEKDRRGDVTSESIDGYSYSREAMKGWADAFADRLRPYRLPRPTRLYYAREAQPWR